MRVTGGILRGRRLEGAGRQELRPTQDRVRVTLFNVLGGRVDGARVADLFAGTGALGVEALSRGASFVVFVESSPRALALLARNVDTLGLAAASRIVRSRVGRFLETYGEAPFDLVLADPPYGGGMAAEALSRLASPRLLAPDAVVVLERRRTEPELTPPAGLTLWKRRVSGETSLDFFTWREP
jgi:16S rRNA (guanine966-N2)-methyltransferase